MTSRETHAPQAGTWSAAHITMAIMTNDRSPQYVYQTLASLFAADPLVQQVARIYLVVDAADASYLGDVTQCSKLTILPMRPEEWKGTQQFSLRQRACHNYYRCLTVPVGESRGLLICEDDVVFRDGFLSKMIDALNEMEHHRLESFVLAGYAPYDFEAHDALRRGLFYCSYPAAWFYGTQCVFYSRSVLPAVTECVYDFGVAVHEEPYDWLIKRYCDKAQNLYATRRGIAQHTGRVTTGLAGHQHTSPTFSLGWPDPETGKHCESILVKRRTEMKTWMKRILEKSYLEGMTEGVLRNLTAVKRSISWHVRRQFGHVDAAIIKNYFACHDIKRLHIGCGGNILGDWLNTDFFPSSARILHLDATRVIPFPDDTFDCIFTEHMIEHISHSDGFAMLRECRRVLKHGGSIRVSTPDLQFLIDLYREDKSEEQRDYIKWATDNYIQSAPYYDDTFVINNFVRAWGHLFIYDEKTLRSSLEATGFTNIVRCKLNESENELLRHLENDTRLPKGFLNLECVILEGTKR